MSHPEDRQEQSPPPLGPKPPDAELLEGFVPVTRRELFTLLGSGIGAVAFEGCTRQPDEKIVPYVRAPEQIVPGKPLFYASSILMGGYASGVLVESHMGRPTKIEGNQNHPASLGGIDAFTAASVRTLYDPERSKIVRFGARISSFDALVEALIPALNVQRGFKGAGLRILSGAQSSPTLAEQMKALLAAFPEARWVTHEPISNQNTQEGAKLAFGRFVQTQHRLDRAEVVLSLDSDFLTQGPAAVRHARDFSARRRMRTKDREMDRPAMNRLYAVETTPTLSGTKADHRLALAPSGFFGFATRLAAALGVPGLPSLPEVGAGAGGPQREVTFLSALVKDLLAQKGSCLILAGESLEPEIHALVHAMNFALGNVGHTVIYTEPVLGPGTSFGLAELTREMFAGTVEILILLDGRNPVYDAPADLELEKALKKVPLRIHHGLYEDETSAHCHWHVPQSHELESWGDARAFDGTLGIIQPLIAPLYASKTATEMVSTLLGEPRRSSYDLLRDHWKRALDVASFEPSFEAVLHEGLLDKSAFIALSLAPPTNLAIADLKPQPVAGLEVVFRPDPTIWDGRFANNAWLQELPKPLSHITWENAIWIGSKTAKRLSLDEEDQVFVELEGEKIKGPIWIVPGHAEETLTLFLGYGRRRATFAQYGYDAYRLRKSSALWSTAGAKLSPTGQKIQLAVTQEHHKMEGRELARRVDRVQFESQNFKLPGEKPPPKSLSLYAERPSVGNAWGMSIDLGACTGCNACVIACQSENNIPTVGRDQVRAGREMHWLRIDQYIQGSDEDPRVDHMPVMCMHCESAPCELVCPVAATTHSPSGLNEMTYNRCVGTRFCSHNCPYKVRRFNYLEFSDSRPTIQMLMNPDVTVRTRGVMEKCSYCVQRINRAHIDSRKENRVIRDREVVTACEGACPSQAIVFGDLLDPNSRVSLAKKEPHSYGILTELNTRPRTTYLARIDNPSPELKSSAPSEEPHQEGHGEHPG